MESEGFAKLEVTRKTGEEPLTHHGQRLTASVIDFWRWSASDLLSNALRGVFAEYIVACALKVTGGLRTEWDAYDLLTRDGIRVEVKSSAYLQSWAQKKLSNISFDIRPTRLFDATTNQYATDLRRQGQVYVFCVLNHNCKATVDPLKMEQWDFYIVSAETLNEKCPTQKTLSLSRLKSLTPDKLRFDEIAEHVQQCVASSE